MPCYNPAVGWTEQIQNSFEKISALLPQTPVRLIIINDGSKKDAERELQLLKSKIPALISEGYQKNMGKGFAVRKGVYLADADIVIYTDIDFPYEEEGMVQMYHEIINNKFDIVLAVRDENYYDDVPFFRKAISWIFKKLIKATLCVPTTDTQAGLKAFNKRGKEIFTQTTINRYLFDLEFVWLAAQQKQINILCLPVPLKKGLHFSRMNWKVLIRELVNFFKIVLRSKN